MERKIREVIEKYIVDMFGAEADDNNQKFVNTYSEEFAELEDHVIDFSKNNINENQLEGFINYELDSILTEEDSRRFIEKSLKGFSKEIYKIVKGGSSIKKISCWEDLNNVKIGVFELDVEETKEDKRDYRMSIVNLKITNTLHDITFDTTFYRKNLDIAVEILKEFGFDIEYVPPFNLVEFLRENIRPEKFEISKANYCFITQKEVVRLGFESTNKILGTFYFQVLSKLYNIEKTLSDNNITPMQLIGALEELGWM